MIPPSSRALAVRASRRMVHQRRGIFDYLTNYPDKIMEQKKIQMAGGVRLGENNPTWWKQQGDVAVLGVGAALFLYAFGSASVGVWRLSTGKGKLE
mmetsp:Transcript_36816/g.56556  ORF Transcript_36816/g.56556 Transcript_36816/m.56556 type:complete len:96 (+) Transcript_36816:69-356(+)